MFDYLLNDSTLSVITKSRVLMRMRGYSPRSKKCIFHASRAPARNFSNHVHNLNLERSRNECIPRGKTLWGSFSFQCLNVVSMLAMVLSSFHNS